MRLSPVVSLLEPGGRHDPGRSEAGGVTAAGGRERGQNRPGAPGWVRRFAANLRLADSPALRREAAQPTPDIPHQKDTRQTEKFKPGLDQRPDEHTSELQSLRHLV